MSTIDRAADVIYDTLKGQYGDFLVPTDAAQALSDAGLLAPNLPEPARRSIEGYHTAHPWAEWDAGNKRVLVMRDGNVVLQDGGVPVLSIIMRPDEAREAAHALLAAAEEETEVTE